MNLANVIRTNAAVYTGDRWACGIPTYNAMYAGYLFGTDYWAGTQFGPTTDITRQDRNATISGAVGAKFLDSPTNVATLPFTVNDVCQDHGTITLVSVTQAAPDIASHFFTSYSSAATDYVSLFASSTYAAQALMKKGSASRGASNPDSDSTRSGFEMIVGAFGIGATQIWRSSTGKGVAGPAVQNSPTVPGVGGELQLQVGKGVNGPAGATQTAAALVYNRELTTQEVREVYAALKALLGSGGLTVEG